MFMEPLLLNHDTFEDPPAFMIKEKEQSVEGSFSNIHRWRHWQTDI